MVHAAEAFRRYQPYSVACLLTAYHPLRPAPGVVDAYWEYRLKPWDMAAGIIIAQVRAGPLVCGHRQGRAGSHSCLLTPSQGHRWASRPC